MALFYTSYGFEPMLARRGLMRCLPGAKHAAQLVQHCVQLVLQLLQKTAGLGVQLQKGEAQGV